MNPSTLPDPFAYRDGRLHAEAVDLESLAAKHGTPLFVYSRAGIERRWHAFDAALGGRAHLVCYAVKANGNLAVLDTLARLGSGFDIVSVGELERVLAAGGRADRVVFSGVGKRPDEMARALAAGVHCLNLESAAELDALSDVARGLGVRAPVALRVNPDVDAQTHPYIATGLRDNKFGIPIDEARALYERAAADPGLEVRGVDFHIGSQLTSLGPFEDALERVLSLVDQLVDAGVPVHHLNVGGGIGVRYRDETPPDLADYGRAIVERIGGRDLHLILEPGRAIVGEAGVLLTRVIYVKRNGDRRFAVVDAAMNDLIRPALYGAWQDVVPVREPAPGAADPAPVDLVGPVCESADFLARDRRLAVAPGDLLAVRTAGAYGMAMSSNYNARPRAAEIMVDRDHAHVARRRETVAELYALESTLPR